ncbi:MAG: AbrB/MazE/SpoVT family DNA-binding domain-containing protein [Pseudomonadota bacterium]|jgi:virulence-associated protein VagC
MPRTTTAKLFKLGKAQAVRIPARFRLDADAVEVSAREDGALILRPKPRDAAEMFARARAAAGDAFEDWRRPDQGKLEPAEPWEI